MSELAALRVSRTHVKITASSNFGNVLSVVAASVFLPFLPMLPSQLIVQNLLYDSAQLALPWDRVDDAYLGAPRRWESGGLVRFMLIFGMLSSTFDLATFAVLWWVFGGNDSPALSRRVGSSKDCSPNCLWCSCSGRARCHGTGSVQRGWSFSRRPSPPPSGCCCR